MRICPAIFVTGLALAACSTSPELSASIETGAEPSAVQVDMAAAGSAYSPEGQAYTVVATSLIDANEVPTSAEMTAISSEQAAFVDWLHMNGSLVAAGPVVAPRGNSGVRQLMFFDTDDTASALERCCEGPASGTGLYRNDASRFVTTTDLSMVRSAVMSGSGNAIRRPYVVVTGPSSLAMRATLGKLGPMVLCQGDCVEGALAGRSMTILDCTDVEDARMFMGEVCPDDERMSYHAWIGPVALSTAR